MDYAPDLAQAMLKPLLRLLLSMSIGILIANILEALRWDRFMARLAAPLISLAHMGQAASASFVLAFFSGYSASTLLSNAYSKGEISKKELVLANIFNSTPSYVVHLPGLTALAASMLGRYGLIYIALGLASALLRTCGTALAARILLPAPAPCKNACLPAHSAKKPREIAADVLRGFKKRLIKVLTFTIPIYILFFLIQNLGGFDAVQRFLGEHVSVLSFLRPEALGVVALSLTAEGAASMSAASALFASGGLSGPDIVAALLVGNILSSPVRAFRHQLPVYAGYYQPKLAFLLVLCNQTLRCLSMVVMLGLYLYFVL